MDSETRCTEFTPEALTTYIYDECEKAERERIDAHLRTCRTCAAELESLQALRETLPAWTLPDPELHVRIVSARDGQPGWWRTMLTPSWGLAAAAALVLVVGAAIASVEIRYDDQGFTFRMGWTDRGAVRGAGGVQAGQTEGAAAALTGVGSEEGEAPWSADLASLADALRGELTRQAAVRQVSAAPTVPQPAGAGDGTPVLEQVEGLILDSERRQRQEFALWFTEFAQELDMQRRADQQRVQQELGALEGVADYLVRVSQR